MKLIKDYNFYGEHGWIETEKQLINEVCRMSLMIATSHYEFYRDISNKILLMDDFIKELNKYIKDEIKEKSFLLNLIECSKEIFNLKSNDDVLIYCIDRFREYLEEDKTQLVYTIGEAVELLEVIEDKLVMPEKYFSPTIYKQLGEFLKTFDCVRTKHKKRTAFKNEGEFTNLQILNIGKQLNGVSLSTKFDFYPTPEKLVSKVQELAEIVNNCSILEPSAGTGNLLKGLDVTNTQCVEMNLVLTEILKAKGFSVHNKTFEEFESVNTFDRILMNPPFSNRLDAKHINKAFKEHLSDKGILVAIHSSAIVTANDKASKEFQKLFNTYGIEQIKVDSEAFKDSGKGTLVSTYITKFKKVA